MVLRRSNTTTYYIIAILVVIVAFFLLDGVNWLKGLSHGRGPSGMGNIQWVQVLIGLAIGFLLGLFAGKRRW
jgi:H+/Cl- antiporter ClcA